jgi:hypothetical protein
MRIARAVAHPCQMLRRIDCSYPGASCTYICTVLTAYYTYNMIL